MSTVEPYASPNEITYQGRDFTEDEALRLTAEIKAWAGTLWVRLRAAHDGKAHKALGYATWTDYLAGEFDIAKSQGYRLLRHSRDVEALADAAGLPDVSPIGDIPEHHTRAIDTQAAAADIAAAVDAEPDADTDRRVEIVDEVIEKHRITTIVDANGEKVEGPSSNAPATPPGPVEQDDDAAPDAEGSATPGEGAAPEGSGGTPATDPSENDQPPAQDSPELLRAKAVKRHGDLMKQARHGLLMLSPIDVAAHCPAADRDDWLAFAGQLADFAERLAAEFTPTLRSVQ